jgi:uncharacterized 2Fe-2S/4Fe-4S cluster protein (DUF4445 family)
VARTIKVNKKSIIKTLGYDKIPLSHTVEQTIDEMISEVEQKIKGASRIKKVSAEKMQAFFRDLNDLKEETLPYHITEAKEVYVVLTTLGEEFQEFYDFIEKEHEYFKMMVLDAIGNWCLQELDYKQIEHIKCTVKKNGGRLGERFAAGDKGIPLELQKHLFKLFEDKSLDDGVHVQINNFYILSPQKTWINFYPVTHNNNVESCDHENETYQNPCKGCQRNDCTMKSHHEVELDIIYKGVRHEIKAFKGQKMLEILRKNNFFVDAACGGRGVCRKCAITISDNVHHQEKKVVLACEYKVEKDIQVFLGKHEENLKSMTIEDRVYVAHQLENFYPCDPVKDGKVEYGLAYDIGTTTTVMGLVDLATGKIIDKVSMVNEQKNYGADVASRISYTMLNKEGLTLLNDIITNQTKSMVLQLCKKQGISCEQIGEMVVAGNPTMTHLFMNISAISIGQFPHEPQVKEHYQIIAHKEKYGFEGTIHVLAGVSGYVGSDVMLGIAMLRIMYEESQQLFLDLGTNGEMGIGNENGIVVCGTAAGPAFEGANLECGTGAISGAIAHFRTDEKGEVVYDTINEKPAIGICGSGIIDIVAVLKKINFIDKMGTFADSINRYWVNGTKIYVNQKDIREIQMAKAAIYAGLKTLTSQQGIHIDEVERLYFAGGFGAHISVENSVNIGLIPSSLKENIEVIGNTSLSGSALHLVSKSFREDYLKVIDKTTYIELANIQSFQPLFLEGMTIGRNG